MMRSSLLLLGAAAPAAFGADVSGLYPLKATGFTAYPGYQGNLSVSGTVYLFETTGGQSMYYHLDGLDEACTAVSGQPNSCGVHVHTGKTCEDASIIGGHYWDSASIQVDPWLTVVYKTDGAMDDDAMAAGEVVATGVTNQDVLDRAFVVHDVTGARVGCATLVADSTMLATGDFVPYAGYDGNFTVSGHVYMTETSSGGIQGQRLWYELMGVDEACGPVAPNVANACGIHIHTGTDCSTAAGGHKWNANSVATDPWLTVTYDASSMAPTSSAHYAGLEVITGLTVAEADAAVFVVHDSTGARIACAEIMPVPTFTTVSASSSNPMHALSSLLGFVLMVFTAAARYV